MAEEENAGAKRILSQGIRARFDSAISIPDGSMMHPDIDPLARFRPLDLPAFLKDPQQLAPLARSSWIARRLVEILSEDLIKDGFTVTFTNDDGTSSKDSDELGKRVAQKLEELDANDQIQTWLAEELQFGDGLIGLGIKHRHGKADPSQPLVLTDVADILYLEVISREDRFRDYTIDADKESKTYGRPATFRVDGLEGGRTPDVLHASRALHLQTRKAGKGEKFGLSYYAVLWPLITLLESTVWSFGQAAFNMSTRVTKSADLLRDAEKRIEMMRLYQDRVNSLASLLLLPDEEIETVSNSPGDMTWLVSFIWDCFATATRIPRSRLLGAQSGVLASAESDMRRYNEFLQGHQRSYLFHPIRRLVEIVLATEALGSIQNRPFAVGFNPVETLTRQEKAGAEGLEADVKAKQATTFQTLMNGLQVARDLGLIDEALGRQILTGKVETEEGGLLAEVFRDED